MKRKKSDLSPSVANDSCASSNDGDAALRLYDIFSVRARTFRTQRATASVSKGQIAAFIAKNPSFVPLFQFLLRTSSATSRQYPTTIAAAKMRLYRVRNELDTESSRIACEAKEKEEVRLQEQAKERRRRMIDVLMSLLLQHECSFSEFASKVEKERVRIKEDIPVSFQPFERWVHSCVLSPFESSSSSGATQIWDSKYSYERPSIPHLIRILNEWCNSTSTETRESSSDDDTKQRNQLYAEAVMRLQRKRIETSRREQELRRRCLELEETNKNSKQCFDSVMISRRELFFTLDLLDESVDDLEKRKQLCEQQFLEPLHNVQKVCRELIDRQEKFFGYIRRLCETFRCERQHCFFALDSLHDSLVCETSANPQSFEMVASILADLERIQRLVRSLDKQGIASIEQIIHWIMSCKSCSLSTMRYCDELAKVAFTGTLYPQSSLTPKCFLQQLDSLLKECCAEITVSTTDDCMDSEDGEPSDREEIDSLVDRTGRHVEAVMHVTESCQNVVKVLFQQPAQRFIPPEMKANGTSWQQWQNIVDGNTLRNVSAFE